MARSVDSSVLIVDDDPAILALLSAMLRRNGLHAISTTTSEEAIKIANSSDIPLELLVTDVDLEGTTGPRLAGEIHRVRPGLPVLYMSAFVELGVIRVEVHGLASGQQSVVRQKPGDFLFAVRMALSGGFAASAGSFSY